MIRVGILGNGGMGQVHARQYAKMANVQLYVHDRQTDRAARLAEEYGAINTTGSDDLISKCDVVDVCLPTDLHAAYGQKVLSAGRALIMEKPLARTLEESVGLLEAATKANVPFGAAQVVRYFPEFAAGHRHVKGGGVGTPAAARTRRGGPPPIKGADNWFMDHARSGGVLLDLAIHDFDWLRWTLGEVTHLYARSLRAKDLSGGPDYALTTLSFEGGAVAHVEATWMDPSGFRTTYEVCGSEGMIEYDSRAHPSLRTHLAGGSSAESPLFETDDPYYLELSAFVDAVQGGSPVPVPAYEGAMAVSIALAAQESAATDRAVRPARI
ncbi:MAG: Gfo/Idh/MocA family oxidoreductase [Fimbriimonadaceae bacterium]|nr:Gfo/Idh/MocA family oxidoreductase [Fimbriimonadaceae bacterium]